MDLFGTKILVVLVLTILIVFSGAVPPAYKQTLDTWYGRIGALFTVLIITNVAGWELCLLAAIAVLTLMPVGVREGFVGGNVFQEATNATCVLPPRNAEGFEADKLQVVPAERRQRWFIEKVMHENPVEIETNNVDTLPTQ
jgi:hypothetical protein